MFQACFVVEAPLAGKSNLDEPGSILFSFKKLTLQNKLEILTYLIFSGQIHDRHYIRAAWRYLDVFWCVFLLRRQLVSICNRYMDMHCYAETPCNSEKPRRTLKLLPALSRHEGE